jgi:PIN domain nuclease of toxin-antitoxin system
MSNVVLDASAVLAYLHNEKGAEIVERDIIGACVSAINATEVVTKLLERRFACSDVQAIMESFQLRIISFDASMMYRTAELRLLTRHLGLSLGDRACLTVAEYLKLPVLTADKQWLNIQSLSIEIICIR